MSRGQAFNLYPKATLSHHQPRITLNLPRACQEASIVKSNNGTRSRLISRGIDSGRLSRRNRYGTGSAWRKSAHRVQPIQLRCRSGMSSTMVMCRRRVVSRRRSTDQTSVWTRGHVRVLKDTLTMLHRRCPSSVRSSLMLSSLREPPGCHDFSLAWL